MSQLPRKGCIPNEKFQPCGGFFSFRRGVGLGCLEMCMAHPVDEQKRCTAGSSGCRTIRRWKAWHYSCNLRRSRRLEIIIFRVWRKEICDCSSFGETPPPQNCSEGDRIVWFLSPIVCCVIGDGSEFSLILCWSLSQQKQKACCHHFLTHRHTPGAFRGDVERRCNRSAVFYTLLSNPKWTPYVIA